MDEPVPDLRTELADVPEDTPIRGELTLESVESKASMSPAPWSVASSMRCARCLKDVRRDRSTSRWPSSYARDPGPKDDYALTPELTLDPEPMVRDAVVLEMPFSPLCRPDCLGLCEICGGDRNLGECPGHRAHRPSVGRARGVARGSRTLADRMD